MQVSIEKYQDKDVEDVISLLVDSFKSKFLHRQSLDPSDIEKILYAAWDLKAAAPGYLHFVAKVNGKIVGVILIRYGQRQRVKKRKAIPFCSLSQQYGVLNVLVLLLKLSMLEIIYNQESYIEHIAVDKFMRGQGIGEQLIAYCEELLKDRGCPALTLAVAVDNPAQHLYSKLGFQEIKRINHRSKQFFTGISHWIFMKKFLIK